MFHSGLLYNIPQVHHDALHGRIGDVVDVEQSRVRHEDSNNVWWPHTLPRTPSPLNRICPGRHWCSLCCGPCLASVLQTRHTCSLSPCTAWTPAAGQSPHHWWAGPRTAGGWAGSVGGSSRSSGRMSVRAALHWPSHTVSTWTPTVHLTAVSHRGFPTRTGFSLRHLGRPVCRSLVEAATV